MLAGKVLNIFMEEKVTPFWMEEYFTKVMCNWFLCFMFIQHIEKLVWDLSGLLTTNIINEKIYKVWTINMSSFLKQISTCSPWTHSRHNSYSPFLKLENLMSSSWSAPKYYTSFVYVWTWAKYMTLMTKQTNTQLLW